MLYLKLPLDLDWLSKVKVSTWALNPVKGRPFKPCSIDWDSSMIILFW